MSNTELKPCPKCGGEGYEHVGEGYPFILCGIKIGTGFGDRIVCRKCGYHADAYAVPYKAIEAWNRRKVQE